jgi:c(7)-type cytochrome triheme protein
VTPTTPSPPLPSARPAPVQRLARSGLFALLAALAGVPAAQEEPVHHNPFHDPESPAYEQLQQGAEGLAGFPVDKRGMPDWMKMLNEGLIKPRATLRGDGQMEVLDLDVILKNTKEMPWVKFPHRSHTLWLACSNCHDEIFVPKAGANAIDMTKIFRGQYCGKCHDRVAFITFFACERCHSVPQGNIKPWWTSP